METFSHVSIVFIFFTVPTNLINKGLMPEQHKYTVKNSGCGVPRKLVTKLRYNIVNSLKDRNY